MTVTERDEAGKIVASRLSSEQAREMQRRSAASRTGSGIPQAEKMLRDLGGLSWDDADESLRVLALGAVQKTGGAVTSHRLLLDRLGKLKTSQDYSPEAGGPCPTCGGQTLVISMTADDYTKFQQSLQED
jgi:hypothetical protein